MRRFHATGTVYGARYVHPGERVTLLIEAANEGGARVAARYDRKLRGDITVREVAR